MDNTKLSSEINIASPVNVSIEVKGSLDNTLSDLLGGLSIRSTPSFSYVEGKVADQAALVGILNTLFNMRFPIIKVMTNNTLV